LRYLWHGVELVDTWGDGPLSDLMKIATTGRGFTQHEWDVRSRAVLIAHGGSYLPEKTMKARDKGVKRCLRKLEERGRVSWALHRHSQIAEAAVESFLDLEHRGWKGESRTSLRSNALDEAFFREVVAGFGAVGRALFTELKLDDQVIASTSNFVSGQAGFAFKTGWLPDLAKMSPGVLNEVELMRSFLQGPCSDLKLFDSGAAEGSYIEKLWSGRRPLVSNAIALSSMGRSVLRVGYTVRAVKQRLRSAGWIATESEAA
jgi:CelD/BcsL family acetyltransferase involved in cellulose biosynthesis